jgi:hypothetical protein
VNENFETALAYVRQTYPELVKLVVGIRLVPPEKLPDGALGGYPSRLDKDLLPPTKPDGDVLVADGQETAEFVNTIVHELTHARQKFEIGISLGPDNEREAILAGDAAEDRFKKQRETC